MAVSVHLYALGSRMARPSTAHARSHDAATCCRASLADSKPRRRSREMAEVAVFRVYFEHLYTGENGVGKPAINFSDSSSAVLLSFLTSAPSKSGPLTPNMQRHLRSTDSC